MTADPFPPHHPPSDLEASTAITPVTREIMNHAAHHAAELVAEAAKNPAGPSGKGGRNRKRAADSGQVPGDLAPMDELGANPEPQVQLVVSEIADQSAPVQTDPSSTGVLEPEPPAPAKSDRTPDLVDVLARFQAKAAEAVRTNVDASFGLWRSMVDVRSIPEAVALTARHVGQQLETSRAHGRELASLAQQFAVESLGRLTHFR